MSLADDMAADAVAADKAVASSRSLADDMLANVQVAKAPAFATPDPSEGGGELYGVKTPQWLDRTLAGAGKAVADMGTGAGQIARSGLNLVGAGKTADRMGLPTAAQVDETKARDAPLMNTGAGQVGYVGGNIAATMLPLAGMARIGVAPAAAMLNPSTYTAAAASGALSGALQPVGTGDSRARNMLIGAGTGMASNAAVNAIGRVAQPVQAAIDPLRAKAVQTLQAAGIPLDTAQQTGSTVLNRMRSSFSDNPFTAGAQAELIGAQKAGFNNAVLSTIGEGGTAATQDVMRRADDRIGAVFKDVLDRNNVQVTDPLLSRIGAVQQAANDEEKGAVSNIANRFINAVKPDGTVAGKTAYGIKKDLDRLASSTDTTLAYHARQLRSAVMDGINDSLPAADQAAFSQARGQFRNMKTIEGAIDKEGSGNISPSILANTLGQKRNRGASIYGRGDQELVNLAQAGKMLLSDKTPNSGTTARAAMQLLYPLGASIAGGSYDAYTGDYGGAATKALAAGGAMIAGPKAAQYLINSPAASRYLSAGIQNVPLRSLMQLPQESDVVGGALRRLPGAALAQ